MEDYHIFCLDEGAFLEEVMRKETEKQKTEKHVTEQDLSRLYCSPIR